MVKLTTGKAQRTPQPQATPEPVFPPEYYPLRLRLGKVLNLLDDIDDADMLERARAKQWQLAQELEQLNVAALGPPHCPWCLKTDVEAWQLLRGDYRMCIRHALPLIKAEYRLCVNDGSAFGPSSRT